MGISAFWISVLRSVYTLLTTYTWWILTKIINISNFIKSMYLQWHAQEYCWVTGLVLYKINLKMVLNIQMIISITLMILIPTNNPSVPPVLKKKFNFYLKQTNIFEVLSSSKCLSNQSKGIPCSLIKPRLEEDWHFKLFLSYAFEMDGI